VLRAINSMAALRARWRIPELSSHEQVIEAPDEDFPNPVKVHRQMAALCARTIADLY